MAFLQRFFDFKGRNATLQGEILGGVISFLSVLYILPVESAMLSDVGMSEGGVFFMTALTTALASVFIGFLANSPMVSSTGMGLNAYLAYTIVGSMGFNWSEGMIIVFAAGILYFLFSLTPVRRSLVAAIPPLLRSSIAVGLGGFIFFVGLQSTGIVVSDAATILKLGDFSCPGVILSFLGFLLSLVLLSVKKPASLGRFALPLALLTTALAGTVASSMLLLSQSLESVSSFGLPIAPWHEGGFLFDFTGIREVVFFGALDGKTDLGASFSNVFSSPSSYAAIFSIFCLSLFNATACMVAVSKAGGLVDAEGNPLNDRRQQIADGVSALLGGWLGTTSITPFAESSTGTSFGARTGLSNLVVAGLFLLSGLAFPLFSVFATPSVYGVALLHVGLLIFVSSLKEIAIGDFASLIPASLTVLTMALAYSLQIGMAMGVISYLLMNLASGKAREIKPPLYVLAALFTASLIIDVIY